MELPYAEEINYWKTGKSAPDTWIEKAGKQIKQLGGELLSHAYGLDPKTQRSAYMILFEIQNQKFRLVQPILPSKGKDAAAAKRQAATLLYHEVKSRCLRATITGAREAFFQYLLLPDGRITTELEAKELMAGMPNLLPVRYMSDGGR